MLGDQLRRAWVPSAVVALSRRRWGQGLRAFLQRPLRLELYFAFDDPYAAVALPGLLRLIEKRPVQLQLYPLVQRGIDQDPAAEARAREAVHDAARLLRRQQLVLRRTSPLPPETVAFLAEWCEAARGDPAMPAFAAAALQVLWLRSEGAVQTSDFALLHQAVLKRAAPASTPQLHGAVQANQRRLLRKGHWESPALWLAGEWFFAHERLALIAERLDELGARAA